MSEDNRPPYEELLGREAQRWLDNNEVEWEQMQEDAEKEESDFLKRIRG